MGAVGESMLTVPMSDPPMCLCAAGGGIGHPGDFTLRLGGEPAASGVLSSRTRGRSMSPWTCETRTHETQ